MSEQEEEEIFENEALDVDLELVENTDSIGEDLHEHYRFVVDRGQSLIRIDKFLTDRLPRVSRNKIQNAIRVGYVLVDNEVVKPNYNIRPNEIITIVFPYIPEEHSVIPENIPLDIIYEDNDLLVVNKPAGMVCHPGVGNRKGTLVNALVYYLQKSVPNYSELGADERPGLVHRIDKDTSGLLLVAKNQQAMTHLARQFFYHTVERRYHALVWGQPEPLEGTIDINIGRSPNDPLLVVPFLENESGKHAVTHYKVIEPMYYVSLVECKLETGRTHQIRVHMKHLGHPLFMDEKYGGARILKGTIFTKYKQFANGVMEMLPRQALHAKSIAFAHPTKNVWMQFESEYPSDFKNGLEAWRKYVEGRRALI